MSHLEEGVLHALLDGEIPSAELAPIQSHLAACAECRARLDAERLLLGEAAGLVELLEVPAATTPTPAGDAGGPRRRNWTRGLAWAASLAAAVGLGYAARGLPREERPELTTLPVAPSESSRQVSAVAPAVDTPPSLGKREPVTGALDAAASRESGGAKVAEGGRSGAASGADLTKNRGKPADAAERVADRKVEKTLAVSPSRDTTAPAVDLPRPGAPALSAPASASMPQPQSLRAREEARGDQGRANAVGRLSTAADAVAPPEPINLPDAVRRLGGSLRLIEGLIPLRLEAQGPYVRVVYRLAQGELVLSQQLIDGRVVYTLLAPEGFSADSLGRLRARVRE